MEISFNFFQKTIGKKQTKNGDGNNLGEPKEGFKSEKNELKVLCGTSKTIIILIVWQEIVCECD